MESLPSYAELSCESRNALCYVLPVLRRFPLKALRATSRGLKPEPLADLASWTASTKANTGASNIFKSACMFAGEALRYGCCRLTACYYPSSPRRRMKNVFWPF